METLNNLKLKNYFISPVPVNIKGNHESQVENPFGTIICHDCMKEIIVKFCFFFFETFSAFSEIQL